MMEEIKSLNPLEIISFLQENGYPVQRGPSYISFPARWRGGDNLNSITGYLNKDLFIDWVTHEKFNTKLLIQRVLNLPYTEIDNYLKNKNLYIQNIEEINNTLSLKQESKIPELFDESVLNDIIKNNDYWVKRGISNETAAQFEGGYCNNGVLKDRQTIIIRNSKNKIIGLAGRDTTNKKQIKWKIKGKKENFCWPAQLNSKLLIEKGEVILVESPADLISVWECGIKNVLCIFGTVLQLGVLNYLLKIKPKKIYVSTNNDLDFQINDKGAGNLAAAQIKKKLDKYFDSYISEIRLPQKKKDLNEMLTAGFKDDIIKMYE